jgi:Predicted glycosyl hydrolase
MHRNGASLSVSTLDRGREKPPGWQPEAIENLAHGPAKRQDRFIQEVLAVLRNAKAAGVVVDWQQIDPAYKKDLTAFIDKFADALHDDNKQLVVVRSAGAGAGLHRHRCAQ